MGVPRNKPVYSVLLAKMFGWLAAPHMPERPQENKCPTIGRREVRCAVRMEADSVRCEMSWFSRIVAIQQYVHIPLPDEGGQMPAIVWVVG